MSPYIIVTIVFIGLSFISAIELFVFLAKHNYSKYQEVSKQLNTRLIILAGLILIAVVFLILYFALNWYT